MESQKSSKIRSLAKKNVQGLVLFIHSLVTGVVSLTLGLDLFIDVACEIDAKLDACFEAVHFLSWRRTLKAIARRDGLSTVHTFHVLLNITTRLTKK